MKNIILLGDIALNGLFIQDKQNNKNRFKEISRFFDDSSFTIANLEVPVKGEDSDVNPNKNIHFYTDSDVVKEIFLLLKIKAVSLANNHIADFGVSGIQNTIDVLDELNILHTGAGTQKEHIDPVIFDLAGKKVAFLAYVNKNTNPKCENIHNIYINYFDEKKVISDLNAAKLQADKIILSIHWGIDYSFYPTQYQIKIAREFVESGADIIMGHHPHTMQPFEEYKRGFIFYSLGGLTFGDYYQKGVLKALPRKTKFSGIPVFTNQSNLVLSHIISIKEQKGNFIQLSKKNLFKWSNRRWGVFKIKEKYHLIEKLVFIKENYLDRIYEFLFGYYKNPIKRFFSLFDLIRIKKIHSDAKVKNERII